MPDISAIASALGSIKAAKDIAEAMIGLRDAQAFQAKRLEFQSKILDAQDAAFRANDERTTLVERIRDLETKMAQLEAWESEKQRYELKEVATSVFAYVLKQEARGTEPSHWICPACYQQAKKSIMQGFNSATFGWRHTCPACKLEIPA